MKIVSYNQNIPSNTFNANHVKIRSDRTTMLEVTGQLLKLIGHCNQNQAMQCLLKNTSGKPCTNQYTNTSGIKSQQQDFTQAYQYFSMTTILISHPVSI